VKPIAPPPAAKMNYSNMIEEKSLKKAFIVATLASTIIGTFTTGINLYERVGEKRKQMKKDSGQDAKIKELEKKVEEASNNEKKLQQSMTRSGPAIRDEYNHDFQRLGPRFAQGDDIAQNQLQSQVIMLQGTVIGLLEDALYTGRISDISKLYNASEFAREGSLSALQGQYQRMLQAGPIPRHRAPGLARRISSSPSMRTQGPAPTVARSERGPASRAAPAQSEKVKVKEIDVESDKSKVGSTSGAAVAEFDSSGPLFCNYSYDLHKTGQPLDICFSKGGACACPMCGTRISVEEGRAWKIVKEIVHDRIVTPEYDDEVIEERTYLISNRFVVKCHREKAGFACILCYRHRDRDTLCETANGLVKHVWSKHDVAEYESEEPDIREVSMLSERNMQKRR